MACSIISYSSLVLPFRCHYARGQILNFIHQRKAKGILQEVQRISVVAYSSLKMEQTNTCVQCLKQNTKLLQRRNVGSLLIPHNKWYSFKQNCLLQPILMNCFIKSLSIRDCSLASNVEVDTETLKRYLDSLQEEYETLRSAVQERKDVGNFNYKQRLQFLESIMETRKVFTQKLKELDDLQTFISGIDVSDEEIRFMAEKEKREYKADINELKHHILERLLPKDDTDQKDVILEITSGAGGQEAMLFASEMFDMYRCYAAHKGWEVEVLDCCYGDMGGIRKVAASLSGKDVFECMKTETGVHRVQRVPKTESKGRIHTSTISVAILPKPSEIEVVLEQKDLKIESMRAQGSGGQHVNKTDSAVRITHIPTGLVAENQGSRSKKDNLQSAMVTLRTKIYKKQLEKQETEEKSLRKQQMGNLDRSEKIRTYNFLQDRITDHRIKETVHNIEDFMSGGEALSIFREKLQAAMQTDKLQTILDEFKNEEKKQKRKGRKISR